MIIRVRLGVGTPSAGFCLRCPIMLRTMQRSTVLTSAMIKEMTTVVMALKMMVRRRGSTEMEIRLNMAVCTS